MPTFKSTILTFTIASVYTPYRLSYILFSVFTINYSFKQEKKQLVDKYYLYKKLIINHNIYKYLQFTRSIECQINRLSPV